MLINVKMPTIVGILTFMSRINVKMPTIVGILTFMSRIHLCLSRVEHEKYYITLGPYLKRNCLFKLEISMVSMSITSRFLNPSRACNTY